MGRAAECPKCHLRLWVSDQAEDRVTVCPKCKVKFSTASPASAAKAQGVPAIESVDDSGIGAPVDDLLKEMFEGGDEELVEGSGMANDLVDKWINDGDDSGFLQAQGAVELEEAEPAPPPAPVLKEMPSAPAVSPKKSAPAPAPAPVPVAASKPAAAPRLAPAADSALKSAASSDDPYERIRPEEIRLRLIELGASDCLIEFPSYLLELPVFRASMPMCCLSSLESDPSKLIAKPLPWVDRLKSEKMSAREFADRFAKAVPPQMSEKEFVASLHPMELLPHPFSMPMPYYVSKECDKEVEVLCRVVSTEYGLGCQVRLPVGPAVLDWVARVNGVCGRDYLKLEQQVTHLQSNEWRSMPEKLRQRLSLWFDWGSDEQFLIYLPDSDFSKSDEGLAGVVLTDKRLVYRKYQKQGVAMLSQPGSLVVVHDGNFCDLSYASRSGDRTRLVRLRRENLQVLLLLLEGIGGPMKIVEETKSAG